MTLRRSNLKNRRLLQKSTHGHTELAQLWWNPLLDHKADHRYILIILFIYFKDHHLHTFNKYVGIRVSSSGHNGGGIGRAAIQSERQWATHC